MQKIEFFLTSFNEDGSNGDIEEIESKIRRYCDLIDYINENNDELLLPDQFYEQKLVNDVLMYEYLYENEYSSDARELLYSYLRELPPSDITYNDLFSAINAQVTNEYKALLGMSTNVFILQENLYINSKEKWLKAHRFYLLKSNSLEEFIFNLEGCFPNLVFHERVYETIKVFKDIHSHSTELVRHLVSLNDYVKPVYLEVGITSGEIFRILKAERNIISSGRGDNEGLNLYICIFKNDEGEPEEVKCNPHTKLYNAYSDYRIYFNWGKDNIKDGRILVGHIGNHWI